MSLKIKNSLRSPKITSQQDKITSRSPKIWTYCNENKPAKSSSSADRKKNSVKMVVGTPTKQHFTIFAL